jgi:hypothetical protein
VTGVVGQHFRWQISDVDDVGAVGRVDHHPRQLIDVSRPPVVLQRPRCGPAELDFPSTGAPGDVRRQRQYVIRAFTQRRKVYDSVDEAGQCARYVLETFRGDGERHGGRAAATDDQIPELVSHPCRQRVHVMDDDSGVRLAQLRRPQSEPRLHVGGGRYPR